MNAADHTYRSDLHIDDSSDDSGNVRLATVFAHELGHAVGLDHVNDRASVMYYMLDAATPTRADAKAFAAILRQQIAGSAPGVFNSTECQGLQVDPRRKTSRKATSSSRI